MGACGIESIRENLLFSVPQTNYKDIGWLHLFKNIESD